MRALLLLRNFLEEAEPKPRCSMQGQLAAVGYSFSQANTEYSVRRHSYVALEHQTHNVKVRNVHIRQYRRLTHAKAISETLFRCVEKRGFRRISFCSAVVFRPCIFLYLGRAVKIQQQAEPKVTLE